MCKLMVIVGSIRSTRNSRRIADELVAILGQNPEIEIDLADLAEVQLPWHDEPMPPAAGNYQNPTTQAWAARVLAADAILLITPEYNGGYPAVVKNALDTVYAEWAGKPFAVATFGMHGGMSCYAQVSKIVGNLRAELVEVDSGVHLQFHRGDLDGRVQLADPAAFVGTARDAVVATGEELVRRAAD